jgi:hypothetical protein
VSGLPRNDFPHDLDAERATLGAVMVAPERFAEVVQIIDGTDFYREAHRDIFAAMRTINARGDAIDFLALKDELTKGGRLDDVGGPAYVFTLADGVPHSTNVAQYARIVQEKARARDGINLCLKTITALRADSSALGNGLPSAHREQWNRIVRDATPQKARLRGLTMPELATYQFEHRRALLCRGDMPILRQGHLAEVYAPRGLGKTWFTETWALVAATGTSALGFSAPEPCRVLRIDGEMAAEELQSRQGQLTFALNIQNTDNLTIVAADWQDGFLPRLDTPEGQAAVEPFVAASDLIVIDNRSTLFDPEAEKDPVAWQPVQDWLLSLRRRGKAVVLVHHSNRQGGARGHSKPEDVMNLLVKLTRPDDYRADQGARFRVEFEKARGAYGEAVAPFTAQLTTAGWLIEADGSAGSGTAQLREYLQLANDANDRPKSATAAIRAARVQKAEGLKVWAVLLKLGEITKLPDGFALRNDRD